MNHRPAAEATPPELRVSAVPRAGAPLLLVLALGSERAQRELERWGPATALGYTVAALELTAGADPGRHGAEIRQAVPRLPRHGRVVTGGCGAAAAVALHLALDGSIVQPGGAVLVAPVLADPLPPAARRLRLAVLLPGPIADPASPVLHRLAERGHRVEVEVVEGPGDGYPADFAGRLPRLLAAATRLG